MVSKKATKSKKPANPTGVSKSEALAAAADLKSIFNEMAQHCPKIAGANYSNLASQRFVLITEAIQQLD